MRNHRHPGLPMQGGGFRSGTKPLSAAATVLVLSLGACAPATNWREVNPPQAANLKALFPCKPDHASRNMQLDGLPAPVELHLLSCEADGATWALTYTTTASPTQRIAALASLHDNLIRRVSQPGKAPAQVAQVLGAHMVIGSTEHPHQGQWWIQGVRPLETGQVAPITVSSWQFSRGLTVFQATVWQNPLLVDDLRLRTFIEGFNFVD
jgi:hypothetical protein